jgi:hypothetical protein
LKLRASRPSSSHGSLSASRRSLLSQTRGTRSVRNPEIATAFRETTPSGLRCACTSIFPCPSGRPLCAPCRPPPALTLLTLTRDDRRLRDPDPTCRSHAAAWTHRSPPKWTNLKPAATSRQQECDLSVSKFTRPGHHFRCALNHATVRSILSRWCAGLANGWPSCS